MCRKDFWISFREADADIFCIQETKMQAGQLDLDLPGYHQYWNYAVRKGYSGTAIFYESRSRFPYSMESELRSTTRRGV